MKKKGAAERFLEKRVSSRVLLIAGLVCIPAFLLQHHLLLEGIQTVSFIIASAAAGKRFRPLPPAVLLITITVLHLFSPIGKVLVSAGRFDITSGALAFGLSKALTIIGLIYLSKATVRQDIRLPGRFGSVVGKTFFYFNKITETWRNLPRQNIIARLDMLFAAVQVEPENDRPGEAGHGQNYPAGTGDAGTEPSPDGPVQSASAAPRGEHPRGTSPAGYVIAALFCVFQWAFFMLQYLIAWEVVSY